MDWGQGLNCTLFFLDSSGIREGAEEEVREVVKFIKMTVW